MGDETKLKMKIIKQSTYETCLACCLLMMVGTIKKDEIEIWKHGWKCNYLMGQLNYVADKHNKIFKVYVENEYYFNQLKKQKNKNIQLVNKKIDIKFLSHLLQEGNAIVYLDNYYQLKFLHTPHFVIASKRIENNIEIVDPYDGVVKNVSAKTIGKAIINLRNHLGYSPVLIILKN